MALYIYSETAFHHMGDMTYMKGLITASAESGAQGIKFQVLLDYDSFLAEKHSMYTEFKKGTFTFEEWNDIFNFTTSLGLDIIFMPICSRSFDLIKDCKHQVKFIDIHSVSFYDDDVLSEIKKSGAEIILGIGGRTTSEIDDKIAYFNNQIKVLMVGYQAFPSNIEELKLGKIEWLKSKYPNMEIGYADHSGFNTEYAVSSNEWAYLLGARYFEKHLSITEGEDRWDFQSAISPEKFTKIREKLLFLDEQVLNFNEDSLDIIEGKELVYRNRQKVAVTLMPLAKGETLNSNNVGLKMLDSADGIIDVAALNGKVLLKDMEQGERLTSDIFQ